MRARVLAAAAALYASALVHAEHENEHSVQRSSLGARDQFVLPPPTNHTAVHVQLIYFYIMFFASFHLLQSSPHVPSPPRLSAR